MKHNHIEEVLLIIAANAFALYIKTYYIIDGRFLELTYPFRCLAQGDIFQALSYSTPFLFYTLALVIFLRKAGILAFKKQPADQPKA